MSDPELRRLLVEVLDFMRALDECALCMGPNLFEPCHERKWKALRAKIKKRLGNAPN